jgi:hypothetical protein
MNMKLTLQLLAPYLAVGLFCCVWPNAWLAILAYHAQIVFWSWDSWSPWRKPMYTHALLLALPAVLAGPILYLLLPHITQEPLSIWLNSHHLSRMSLLALIPYFGLLHPVLEQRYWARLREQTPLSHPMFAGYHLVVLVTLLKPPWLVVCFVGLTAVSVIWQHWAKRTHSLAAPIASHILADLGIVIVAWMQM